MAATKNAKPAKKNAKPAKAKAQAAYEPANPDKLNKPQRQILGCLSKLTGNTGIGRREIAERVDKTAKPKLINGRIAAETANYTALLLAKLVQEKEVKAERANGETGTDTVYSITPAGRAALKKAN